MQQQYQQFSVQYPGAAPQYRPVRRASPAITTLRIVSIICNAVIIGLAFHYAKERTEGPILQLGPPAAAAILWDLTDTIWLLVARKRYAALLIPAVLLDPLLFLGLGAMSGVIAFALSIMDDSGYYLAYYTTNVDENLLRIIMGFGILATVLRAGIVIIVGMATWRYRKDRARAARRAVGGMQSSTYAGADEQRQAMLQSDEPPPAYSMPLEERHPQDAPGRSKQSK